MALETFGENPKTLDFFHEGKKYSIPHAYSAKELWPFLHNRVLPGLEKLKAAKADQSDNLEIGLCFAWFVQEGEGFEENNPESARTINDYLKNAGLQVPDIPYKADRFCTIRNSFLHRMKDHPNGRTSSTWTFVLAPAFALARNENNDKDCINNPDKYEIELVIDDGVAICLGDLLKGKNLCDSGKVYYRDIVEVMDRLINIKLTK